MSKHLGARGKIPLQEVNATKTTVETSASHPLTTRLISRSCLKFTLANGETVAAASGSHRGYMVKYTRVTCSKLQRQMQCKDIHEAMWQ